MRNEEIDAILEAVAQEEKQLRSMQLADMKKGWDDQLALKKQMKLEGRAKEKSDFHTGPTMEFRGEDKLYPQRKAAQQEQMRRWTQEDMDARARQKAREMAEEIARAELARQIDEFREQQEREEERMRKELTKKILQENGDIAELRAKLRAQQEADNDLDPNNTLVLDNDATLDEYGYPTSKDGFRGLTPGQRKQLLMENEELIRLKKLKEVQDKADDDAWYREGLRMQRAMAQAELEEQEMRTKLKAEISDTLAQQVSEKNRRDDSSDNAYGKIEGDFYAKFGTSCR
ncbi:unnamed protein product [Symbiodinium microadriaticum]|nr:unnamed protein product [Symbiodinium microadriaticum]